MRLIDADDLHETFGKECDGECTICSHSLYNEKLGSYCELIINAPTVHHPDCEVCEDKAKSYSMGFQDGFFTGKKIARPQGEWLKAQGEWVTDTAYKICFKCSECKAHFGFPFNFCPNCGADMRKE